LYLLPSNSTTQLRAYSHTTPRNNKEDDKHKNHPVLPHLNTKGDMHMTNVGSKPSTQRYARASCRVHFTNGITYDALTDPTTDDTKGKGLAKGDVFAAARVAGIMAAKKTPDIIPLCHPSIGIDSVSVDVLLVAPGPEIGYGGVEITVTVTCEGRTGVEMEAMTAVMGAALTVYDMCKANDKGMIIGDVKLEEKRGGKSGVWRRALDA
jgi:molybdenum cofactor biosynthesis protein MoaC